MTHTPQNPHKHSGTQFKTKISEISYNLQVTFAVTANQFEKDKHFQELMSFLYLQIKTLLIKNPLKTNLVYFPTVSTSISHSSSKHHMKLESLLIQNQ